MDLDEKKRKIFLFMLISVFSFLFYIAYLPMHYSVDTWTVKYEFLQFDKWENMNFEVFYSFGEISFINGRFLRGLLIAVFALLRISHILASPLANFVGVFFIGASFYFSYQTLLEKKKGKDNLLLFTVTAIMFLNPYLVDWLQFTECGFFYPMGMFFAILASRLLYQSEKKWKGILLALFFLSLSAGLYQMNLQYFVWLSLAQATIDSFENKDSKGISFVIYIKNIVLALVIYVGVSIEQLFLTTASSSRLLESGEFLNNLQVVIKGQVNIFKMSPYTGSKLGYFFSFLLVALLVIVFIMVSFNKKKKKEKIFLVIITILNLIGLYLSIMIPIVITEAWMPGRVLVGIWGLFLFPVLTFTEKSFIPLRKKKWVNQIVVGAFSILLMLNFYQVTKIGTDLQKVNSLDRENAKQIQQVVDSYQKDTGKSVSKVAFANDKNIRWGYDGIFTFAETNIKAWAVDWTRLSLLNLSTGNNYIRVDFPKEIFTEYFYDKDWSYFSSDQIYIEEDTAYIVSY